MVRKIVYVTIALYQFFLLLQKYMRITYNRLVEFLTTNNVFTDFQFGFRKDFSPKQALLKLIDSILDGLSKWNFVVSVFIDLKKAS